MSLRGSRPLLACMPSNRCRAPVYYLVGSQGQARLVQSQLLIWDSAGEPPLLSAAATVVVAGSAEEELRVRQEIDGYDDTVAAGGPAVRVFDLRPYEERSPEHAVPGQ